MQATGTAAHASRQLLAEPLGAPASTPGGPGVAVVLCILPIAFLILVTVVRRLVLPTSVSLPAAAAMLAFIRLAYLSSPPLLVTACFVSGLLEALTPLSIITGAILLFQSMHHTQCLPWMMGQIKQLSAGHPVAEVFLIGFAFAYLVEGASGFGTPVALGAPMLASLGHDPLLTIVCLLIMNTLATQFGAVGTPIWFGFGDIGLGEANLQLVGLKAAILVGLCAYVAAPLAASFLVPWRELLRSSLFVVLSISTAVVPSIGIALFSYEFPSLVGGLASVALTGLLVRFKVGLRPVDPKLAVAQAAAASAVSLGSAPPAAARTSMCSTSFSFVEGVGAVEHAPVPTLQFPLPPDVHSYSWRHHDFAAQADEQCICAELAALTSSAPARVDAAGAVRPSTADAPAKQAGSVSSGSGCPVTPLDAAPESDKQQPAAALGKSADLEHGAHSTPSAAALPSFLRTTRGGSMQLDPLDPDVAVRSTMSLRELVLRTLPIWLTVLVLLITRIPALPVKKTLQSTKPSFTWQLGTLGSFGISASLVVQLRAILTHPAVSWKYEVLYVPFVLPFVLASCITLLVHRRDLEVPPRTPFVEAVTRVKGITIATLGALVLVQLIRVGGVGSPAYIIGYWISSWLGQGFLAISAFLGALGSFFSGSTTVSNLTFGDIAKIAAEKINAPVTALLAVQVLGATIGNAVCIANILSAKAVCNLNHVSEGEFIRRTAPVALLMLLMGEALGLIFTLGRVLPDHPMLSRV